MAEDISGENEAAARPGPTAELARLRDRTDELELIISSLTMVALFALPGWLMARFSESYIHLSAGMTISGGTVVSLLSGLSYALAACFMLHLLTRAYWVGLVGLRSVFPHGIDWRRTPGVGPLTEQAYRKRLPDLQTAIERSDHLASSIFAVISVIGLAIFWVMLLILLAATAGGVIGARFGATNVGVAWATLGIAATGVLSTVLLWFCDAVLARRFERLRRVGWFAGMVGALVRINGWLLPQRVLLPVQLTLQSNTRPIAFMALFALAIVFAVIAGQLSFSRASSFTLSGEYQFLDESHFDGVSFRSSYYEDMRDERDRLNARPSIPSFEQGSSHVRVFLPYHPLRDNPLLQLKCPGEDARLGRPCLQRLWSIELNDESIDLSGFVPAERLDLGRRGLVGVVSLDGLEPGLQTLTVVWNPDARIGDAPIDDRYTAARFDYQIPFLFAPAFEVSPVPPVLSDETVTDPATETIQPQADGGGTPTAEDIQDSGSAH